MLSNLTANVNFLWTLYACRQERSEDDDDLTRDPQLDDDFPLTLGNYELIGGRDDFVEGHCITRVHLAC